MSAWSLPLTAATSRLLSLWGVREAWRAPAPRPEQASLGWALAQCLRAGREGRVVQVPRARLASLRLPALLPLTDGSAALLTRVGRARAEVMTQDGVCVAVPIDALLARYQGVALESLAPDGSSRRLFGLWLQTLTQERRALWSVLYGSLALSLLGPLAGMLAARAVDSALPEGARATLLLLALGLLAASLHRAFFGYVRDRALADLEARAQLTALRQVYARFMLGSYAAASRRTLGMQLQLVELAERAARLVSTLGFGPLFDVASAAAYAAALLWIAPGLGAVALGVSGLCLGVNLLLAGAAARLERERLDAGARLGGFLYETIGFALTLKAAGAVSARLERWFELLLEERVLGLRRDRAGLGQASVLLAAQQLVGLLVLGLGAHAVLQAELSVGQLAAALMYADGVCSALARLSASVLQAALLRPQLRELDAVLAEHEAAPIEAAERIANPADADCAILLERVWFRYAPDQPWVLKDYSLKVARGERFELDGVSGRGKTTVLRLVAGLLVPERGRVRVNGKAPAAARDAIAYLPQDSQLLEGSLLDNLAMLSAAPLQDIERAAERTGLAHWVRSLPMGYETLLPPGAATLSGGQRQLLAFTAAVASRRPVLLLDEATSHIDPRTRAELADPALFAGKTVLAVQHAD